MKRVGLILLFVSSFAFAKCLDPLALPLAIEDAQGHLIDLSEVYGKRALVSSGGDGSVAANYRFSPAILVQNTSRARSVTQTIAATDPVTGDCLGSMTFRFSDTNEAETGTLEIKYLDIRKETRNKGISRMLLTQVMELYGPHVEYIETSLGTDNLKAYNTALKSGMNPLQAFMQTPAYKIRASLGYRRVVHVDARGRNFTVSKK